MRKLQSRPLLRWVVPLGFLLVLLGTGVLAVRASAQPRLPYRSPEELLVAVQRAQVDGLSGTVVQQANLGIPEIPGSGSRSSDFNALVSGSHTLRVWSSGQDKSRIALLGTLGESDLIVNGADVWTWASDDNAATHRRLTRAELREARNHADSSARTDVPKTPEQAAQRFLAAVGPTTEVTTASDVTVADRPAYELVLTPKDSKTLIRQVRISVDGTQFVPLRVQVFGADANKPVAEVGFTHVAFARPDDAQFRFNPPPGAKVTEVAGPSQQEIDKATARTKAAKQQAAKRRAEAQPKIVGKGWSQIMVAKAGEKPSSGRSGGNAELQSVLQRLPHESGSWGSGRVLRGTAFSVVLTDDGRVAAGAVRPEALFTALG